jgi:hypothetical protein
VQIPKTRPGGKRTGYDRPPFQTRPGPAIVGGKKAYHMVMCEGGFNPPRRSGGALLRPDRILPVNPMPVKDITEGFPRVVSVAGGPPLRVRSGPRRPRRPIRLSLRAALSMVEGRQCGERAKPGCVDMPHCKAVYSGWARRSAPAAALLNQKERIPWRHKRS